MNQEWKDQRESDSVKARAMTLEVETVCDRLCRIEETLRLLLQEQSKRFFDSAQSIANRFNFQCHRTSLHRIAFPLVFPFLVHAASLPMDSTVDGSFAQLTNPN